MLEKNSKYLNSIRVFPFFSVEMKKKKLPIKEDTKKMENCKADNIRDKFFTDFTGNRGSLWQKASI